MTITSIATRILAFARRVWSRLAPLPATAEPLAVAADLCCRSRRELVLENAALRHQLGVLRRRSPNLGSRNLVYTAACRNPTQEWTAQQLRNATMDGEARKILLRDRDDKYGATFDRVAEGVGTRVIKTTVRAPNMNAMAERFVGSSRREMLDPMVVLDEHHLGRLVKEYRQYANEARPHQGIGQRIPGRPAAAVDATKPIVAKSVLGGLHHNYRRAA